MERLTEDQAGRAAIVASELGSNLVKYAQKGVLQVAALSGRRGPGVEIVAFDSGPGMPDVASSLVDGRSTGTSPGTGLGAVRRLSDEFDIYSQPGRGTVVVSQIYRDPQAPRPVLGLGVTMRPVNGESVSGDAWGMRAGPGWALLMVADGLGHGLLAADAAAAAVNSFQHSRDETPVELVQTMHQALRGRRGAAVAVARLERQQGSVRFAGLGNIAGTLQGPTLSQGMVSHNGTAGFEARNIREFIYTLPEDSIIVMHSDGISSNWNMATYPGLLRRHEALISATIYRDASRDRDDACVITGRWRQT